ncbi:aminoacyl-tRNA hydrolase [Phycisphaera mikurensis]|uniref:Peptidyl-tRNA hydrolase n=1 Tax=Phycisphaera mikurensis (strain NBRC 102666 / KCTC 22515 / FYK2301M01) TaxID=1142394 RepID=I0IHQ7_PHYMF|nr:aminoacyl-tRNA hydrolase [Phycisphaera mikurensis]MBB6441039.1 PTH1 family peptidyl-tRNA hydrolase [Phycisphaera mikurensis]BAM04795.1 peptidyl-tRNA hydrolase [Phycisphaera mikurensis NBRC 102666]
MKLIIGLGNPGREYADTRHNAGFMVLERFATRHGLAGPRQRFHAGTIDGSVTVGGAPHKLLLVQPLTYMNRSGQSVREAVDFYKVAVKDVLIVVDDIAFGCGDLRLKAMGSAGGHNGLKDVERVLGTRAYARLRIGIDAPGRIPQVDYVLGRFTADQRERLDPALDEACQAVEAWLTLGIEKAMNKVNDRS